jgi:hypothetical protein
MPKEDEGKTNNDEVVTSGKTIKVYFEKTVASATGTYQAESMAEISEKDYTKYKAVEAVKKVE